MASVTLRQPWARTGMEVSTRKPGTPITTVLSGVLLLSQYQKVTHYTALEHACLINGKSRSRFLIQPSYSIVDILYLN